MIIACHSECCTPDETSLPAVRWMPQRRESGIVLVPCCRNHAQTWWEGADWDGRDLEVLIPWKYSVDFDRLDDFVSSHGFGSMNGNGRKVGYELVTRDGDYAAAGATISAMPECLRKTKRGEPVAPKPARISYMATLTELDFNDYALEDGGNVIAATREDGGRLEVVGHPKFGPYCYESDADKLTVIAAVETAARHLNPNRIARVLLDTRSTTGWIEHTVQILNLDRTHRLTIAVIQRKEGADIERCS